MPADHEPLPGEVSVRGPAVPVRYRADGSLAVPAGSCRRAASTRGGRSDRSPVIVIGALVALSAVVVGGRAGGAAAVPQWMRPAPSTIAAPSPDPPSRRSAPPALARATPTTTATTPRSITSPAAGAAAAAEGLAGLTTAPPGTAPPTQPPTQPAPPPSDSGNGGANRPIPVAPQETAPSVPAPPWATSVGTTAAGFVTTRLGCAAGTSSEALDAFFTGRIGPVIGMDYQHVYPLGGRRFLWLFQDTFLDQSGAASRLSQAAFAHNVAMVQDGACFTLYTRGTPARPQSFEPGTGESVLSDWFWPMGGAVVDGRLQVFWAEMRKDPDPGAGNGLGWHPARTWLATYDATTLARLDFRAAPNAGTSPIYGYAVDSDAEYTYLFANTFEQNLDREGGYGNGPHSGTKMFLGRVPLGRLDAMPEYYTPIGWVTDASQAEPISQRYWVENPMQPRFLDGRWVAATKVDGYWGEQLAIDVADHPWGPWTTTEVRGLSPRGDASVMNTYHAHLMPWLDGTGQLIVSYSQNARNMLRDAWPHPERYRPAFTTAAFEVPPAETSPGDAQASTTVPESTALETTIPETTSAAALPSTDPTASSTNAPATTAPTNAPATTAPVSTTSVPTTSVLTTVPPDPTTGTSSTSSSSTSSSSTSSSSTSSTPTWSDPTP